MKAKERTREFYLLVGKKDYVKINADCSNYAGLIVIQTKSHYERYIGMRFPCHLIEFEKKFFQLNLN